MSYQCYAKAKHLTKVSHFCKTDIAKWGLIGGDISLRPSGIRILKSWSVLQTAGEFSPTVDE